MSAVNDSGQIKMIDKLIINGTECMLDYASVITNKPDFIGLSLRVTALENSASTGGSGGSGGSDDYATYAELQALSSNVDKLDDDIFNISQRLSAAEYTVEDLVDSRPIVGVNDAGLYLKVGYDGKWALDTELPSVTSADQGKVLTVDSTGKWAPENAVTYESKSPESRGTALSLVTTGEKYSWNECRSDLDRISSYHSSRISAFERHFESLDTESENLVSRMNSAETDLSEIHSAIDAIEENISALSGVPADITSILDAITIINQRLTALENGESGSITHASVNDKKLTMTDGNASADGTKVTVSAANMAVFGSKLTIQ